MKNSKKPDFKTNTESKSKDVKKSFCFKQFAVHQDRCAMKIGTDGVLLGAWTPIDEDVKSILDIGTGTGVLGLMMAQRCEAEVIDALEIDTDAYEQAVENFEDSPWGDRLFCYHASFQEFFHEIEDTYDLIISNPPFFTEDYKTENANRDAARFEDALPFGHLLHGVSLLLSEKGKFAVIIPYREEENFISLAALVQLVPQKITRVSGTVKAKIKRSMILFSFSPTEALIEDELIIEKERHQYTEAYRALTHSFYLNME